MSARYLVPLLTLKDNGGVSVVMTFVRQMVDSGDDVTILASSFHGTRMLKLPENAGIRFVITPTFFQSSMVAMLLFFVYAFYFSLSRQPRLIYTHIATGLIPNFNRCEPYMLAQDIEYRFFSGVQRRIAKILFSRLLGRCRLLVSSEWLGKFFRRKGYRVIFQGDVGISKIFVPTEAELANGNGVRPIDYLLIAKRGSHKRHTETVLVAEELARRGFRVTLIDQDPATVLKLQGASLNVFGAVPIQKMRELFSQSLIFVSLSRAEGYGLTPLEALSQGCKVVTTPTPSTLHLHHSSLEVISGSELLVERSVKAATNKFEDLNIKTKVGVSAATVPLMEDWAHYAFYAFRITRDQN